MDENPFLDRLRDTRLARKQPRKTLVDQQVEKGQESGQFDDLDGEGKPLKKGPSLTAARVGTLAEQRIQAAMEDGLFDNLEGEGKPLDLYDDAHVPVDMRMAFRMLKGQQAGAPWLGAMRDYEQELRRYILWRTNNHAVWSKLSPAEQQILQAELPKRIKTINDLAHQMNAILPTDTLRVGLFTLARELPLLTGEV